MVFGRMTPCKRILAMSLTVAAGIFLVRCSILDPEWATEPKISLSITSDPKTYSQVGDIITYYYTMHTRGVLYDLTLKDDIVELDCPNMYYTCIGTYEITERDIYEGSVTNTAVASAEHDRGWFTAVEIITVSSQYTVTYREVLSLYLTKTSNYSFFMSEGQLISYTFEIENNGNVPISPPFAVDDPQLEQWDCPNAVLDPGEKMTCTGNYYTRHGDVGNTLRNCATASGIYQGEQVTSNSACVEIQFAIVLRRPLEPYLTLTKTANRNYFSREDQLISYTFEIENTSSVPVSPPFTVDDPQLEQWDCPNTVLSTGEKMTCTGNYYTHHRDVGYPLRNCATVSGIYQGEQVTSNSACVHIPFYSNIIRVPLEPDLTLTKTAKPSEFIDEGQLISYTFEIENTGSAHVSPPFTIDDPQLEQWDCPNAVLYPGEKMTCTGIYYTRHGDVGDTLKNCATVSGFYYWKQVTSNSACVEIQFIQYRRPMDTTAQTACEQDPNSIECTCEKDPTHPDCN